MPGFHNQYSASAFIDFVSFKNEIKKKKKNSILWTSCFDLYEPPDSVMYVPVLLKPLQRVSEQTIKNKCIFHSGTIWNVVTSYSERFFHSTMLPRNGNIIKNNCNKPSSL